MTDAWIKKYFPEENIAEASKLLEEYGTESRHREVERVRRDIVIISRGSMDALRAAVGLAKKDYREILIGEQVDPWVIGELKKTSLNRGTAAGLCRMARKLPVYNGRAESSSFISPGVSSVRALAANSRHLI